MRRYRINSDLSHGGKRWFYIEERTMLFGFIPCWTYVIGSGSFDIADVRAKAPDVKAQTGDFAKASKPPIEYL